MTRSGRWVNDPLRKLARASALVLGCLFVLSGEQTIARSVADPAGGAMPPAEAASPSPSLSPLAQEVPPSPPAANAVAPKFEPLAGAASPAGAVAPTPAVEAPASELPRAATPPSPDASTVPAPTPALDAPQAAPPIANPAAPPVPPTDAIDHGSELDAAHLPHDLSPWGMFMAADVVVKSVMIGLALASLLTWTVWFSKSLELMFARRSLKRAAAELKSSATLPEAAERAAKKSRVAAALIDQAHLELRLSADVLDKAGILDRIGSRLQDVSSAAGRSINRGTGLLATIGSTAPFIGLFGTVWGIMNSFIGISKAQTTNLAVVAPGIAEALLATALGLVAAIPAVIIYNQFSRSIGSYKASLGEISSEVMRHVSRDLDRGAQVPKRQAAAE